MPPHCPPPLFSSKTHPSIQETLERAAPAPPAHPTSTPMSDPSLPPPPAPPPMGGVPVSSSPLRRRARDDALEEGELRVPDSDSEDDGRRRRHLFQPRVEYSPAPEDVRRPSLRGSLDALDILLVGAGAGGALPSPTPSSSVECGESDATLSDDGGRGAVVDRGWAATGGAWGKRRRAVGFPDSGSDLEDDAAVDSAGDGGQAGPGTGSAEAAPVVALHHQPPPKLQEAQPPRAPQPPPRRQRERRTEYTCKVCGKTYTNNQALGGHAAGHKNKQREAEAMAAAVAAAAAGGGDGAALAAAFPALRRGGGGAKAHECRHCGKVFGTGLALGGHMRVHYTGPPIVPARKNKKRCLAPPPPPPTTTAEGGITFAAAPPVGLSLGLSIKAEETIVAAAVAPPAVAAAAAGGLSLGLSIKAEEEPPPASTPPAAPAGVVRLFGIDINPQVQAPAAPLEQQHQGSGGTTTEDSSSTGQQQH